MSWKFQFDHTNKWYMHNPSPVLEIYMHKALWDFSIQTDHLIPARRPDLIIINNKKKICKIVDFAVPADHRINQKEIKRKISTTILLENWNAVEWLCQLWLVLFGTITKGLLNGLEDLEIGGRVETIQKIALPRTARILRRVLETWGDLLSLKLQC